MYVDLQHTFGSQEHYQYLCVSDIDRLNNLLPASILLPKEKWDDHELDDSNFREEDKREVNCSATKHKCYCQQQCETLAILGGGGNININRRE